MELVNPLQTCWQAMTVPAAKVDGATRFMYVAGPGAPDARLMRPPAPMHDFFQLLRQALG